MIYTVDYFISQVEKIPESMWITRDQGTYGGPCCAFGHCRISSSDYYGSDTDEGRALGKLFFENGLRQTHDIAAASRIDPNGAHWAVASINNGTVAEYQQPTPKQRILAALYDIKAMTAPKEPEPKIKTVYVSVPVSITEQAKQLVTN
jgi:hypothetical protein